MNNLPQRSDFSLSFRAEPSLYPSFLYYLFPSGRGGLSVVLVLMLLASLLPMTAKSARGADACRITESINGSDNGWNELNDAINRTADCLETYDIYITLNNNVTSSSAQDPVLIIEKDRVVTLDLNGNTIDRNMSSGSVFRVLGTLRLLDSKNQGMITGGNTDQGGGVYVAADGTFEMSGGTITGNTAAAGGGVYVAADGTFEMSGGTITGNAAAAGGGVYIQNGSPFTLSGSPEIYDNTSNNIYLYNGAQISIGSELNITKKIGITMAVPGVFALDNDPDHNNDGKFISDDPAYKVFYDVYGGKGYFKLGSTEKYSIAAVVSPEGSGTVNGSGTYIENTSATLNAIPSTGYRFVNWTEGGSEVSPNAEYTFTVTGSRSLTAHFEQNPAATFSVTVIKEGEGTAFASPDRGPAGLKVTLSAEPAEGYQFKEWQVVSGGVIIADDSTFTIGTENVSVKAVFQKYTYHGEGEDHLIGSGKDAVFTIKRSVNDELSFDKFKEVRIDGADVDPENYTAARGSVIITLKAAYLDTLSPGQHTLTVVFEDGEDPVPFNVTESAEFKVPVEFVFIQYDGSRGVPFDIKEGTLKPVLTLMDGEEAAAKSAAIELAFNTDCTEDKTKKASFPKKLDLAPGKYAVTVSGLPKEIAREVPEGEAADKAKIKLSSKAEINKKDGEIVITVYLIFDGRILPKYEEPVVYPLPEDEIGAYALRKDGTKEYLLFHTYDICMSWLGKDELCRGYERCFHKDGK